MFRLPSFSFQNFKPAQDRVSNTRIVSIYRKGSVILTRVANLLGGLRLACNYQEFRLPSKRGPIKYIHLS
jgi:hypothetical protein